MLSKPPHSLSRPPVMSGLIQGYSSDEDEDVSQDAFGIASLPNTKRARFDDAPVAAKAAPNVLAEVLTARSIYTQLNTYLYIYRTP